MEARIGDEDDASLTHAFSNDDSGALTKDFICVAVHIVISDTLFMVSATAIVLLALLQPSQGYIVSPTFVTKHPPKFQRKLSLIHSSKDESVSLAFDDQTATYAAAESFNVTLTDPSNFVQQRGESTDGSSFLSRSKIAIIVATGVLIALSQLPQMTTFLTLAVTNYSRVLHDYPLPTKSLTAGALCGVSDVIAQYRDSSRKEFNFRRWIRFAGKSHL